MTSPALQIATHTPFWVWGLLAALIGLGLKQTRDRLVGLGALSVWPLVMIGLSFSGMRGAFDLSPAPVAAWALGLAVAATAAHRAGWPRGLRWDAPTGRVAVPGSRVPLALMMLIFAVKFGVGATLALHAAVATEPAFAASVSAAYGAFSGIFLCRSIAAWRTVPDALGRLRTTPAPNPDRATA